MLVKMRAQKKSLSPLGQVLHIMARSQVVGSLDSTDEGRSR